MCGSGRAQSVLGTVCRRVVVGSGPATPPRFPPLPRLAVLAVLPNLPNGWEETRRERDLHEAHDICDMSGPWKTSLWIS